MPRLSLIILIISLKTFCRKEKNITFAVPKEKSKNIVKIF